MEHAEARTSAQATLNDAKRFQAMSAQVTKAAEKRRTYRSVAPTPEAVAAARDDRRPMPKDSVPFALVSVDLLLKPEATNHFFLLADHWGLDPTSDNFAERFQTQWSQSVPRIGRAWRAHGQLHFRISRPLKAPEMSELAEQDDNGALRDRLATELAALI